MKVISKQELIDLLMQQKGKSCKMVGLKTRTVPEMNVKSRTTDIPLAQTFSTTKIFKESKITGQINADYENSVNNRLEKDGQEANFTSSGLCYGEFVDGSKILIKNKDQYYIRIFQTNSILGKDARYYKENGEELSDKEEEDLKKNFLKLKPEFIPSQNLDYEKSSKPTNYKLESIKEITIDGEQYAIK